MKNISQDFAEGIKTNISVNELLQVQITDDPNPATYASRINDISEGKLVIAWPTNGGIRLLVHRDQILEFSFVREGTAYSFSGLVDETSIEPIPQITVILSSAIVRVQRRQNFRIKCLLPVEVVGSIKDRDDTTAVVAIRTITYDISASGIALRYPKLIPEGTVLEVKLGLPDSGPPIKIPCRVVHSQSLSENQTQYRTGITYLALSESERARIVRFVYRTQLKGLHP